MFSPFDLHRPFYTQRPFASTGIAPRGPLRAALPCLRHLPFELSLFGASPRYYGLVRLLASLSLHAVLPSSLAELSEHATLLCPAEFHPPKSVRRSPVGFIMSEQWPRGTLVTRLYEGGTLALSLIRLSGETRAHRSPSARLTVLTVC